MTASASSSIYSVDRQDLGYTPFEYWKGPKPVSWALLKEENARRKAKEQQSANARALVVVGPQGAVVGGGIAGSRKTGGAPIPLQPVHMRAAQQLVASYAAQLREPPRLSMLHRNHDSSYPGAGQGASHGMGTVGAERKGGTSRTDSGPRRERLPRFPPPSYSSLDDKDDFSWQPQKPLSREDTFDRSDSFSLRSGLSGKFDAEVGQPAMARRFYEEDSAAWYDFRSWSKRKWALVVVLIILLIVAAVAIPIAVVKSLKPAAYPDYSKLKYTLRDTYSGEPFFEKFTYLNGWDKTNGWVHYADPDWAKTYNLTYATSESALVRVDTKLGPGTTPDASNGRLSVRLVSKTQYDRGLFVFDVKHTPYGCGTWPALWLTDMSNWPKNGEIDVMEGVNTADTGNIMSLHSTNGCSMDSIKRVMSGSAAQGDCNNNVNGNSGCGVTGTSSTFGEAFNRAGGGVMAVEWRTEGIRMWQFGRTAIPSDITNKNPDPSTWGTALADFPSTSCDVGSHFRNQSIIVNIDLCGDWAGRPDVYGQSGCPSNCTNFVSNNPDAFKTAYWEFGSFQVYDTA